MNDQRPEVESSSNVVSGNQQPSDNKPNQLIEDTETTICILCREVNLTDRVVFNTCKRCGETYCLHYASTIDPGYCTHCLHDVQVREEIVTKTETHYNEETDKTYTKTRRAKRISLGGMHWLFQARKIQMMTDLELELAIEYHRDTLNSMLYERDERRSQKAHRNAGKPLPLKFNGAVTESENTVQVTKTKVKQGTKVDPQAQLAAALRTLSNAGLTAEMIAKIAAGGKK